MDTVVLVPAPRKRRLSVAGRYWLMDHTWPASMPPLTAAEAKKAARLLWLRFYHRRRYEEDGRKPPKPPKIWVEINPNIKYARQWYNGLEVNPAMGWHSLVHSLSHRFHYRLRPGDKPHSDSHRHLEHEMIAHVITSGWLAGKLKSKSKRT